MRKFLLSTFCLSSLLLVGCASAPKEVIVHKKEFVLLEVDPRYLQDCHVVAPPDEQLYLESSLDVREDMLTRTILDQYQASRECSNDKRAIRALLEKHRAQIKEFNSQKEVKP